MSLQLNTPKASSNHSISTASQQIKKSKCPQNDENLHQYQTSKHTAIKQNYVSSPMGSITCSININTIPQHLIKNCVSQLSTSRESPKSNIDRKNQSIEKTPTNLMNLIDRKQVVGRGGFGKVWRVQIRGTGRCLALKEMSKALVIAKKSVPSVMNEKSLLISLDSPFIVNLLQAHQDRQNLYLLLDFLPGGDLRHHLSRRKFNEQQAKFLIACILLGLKYIHSKSVIHRDIKPQNIVLDKKGYARLTDLGVARPMRPNNSTDTSGTPGYMAPQVLCRQNHTFSVDYFAVGVIAHELMLRRRPFNGRSRKQIRQEVLARQVQIKKHEIPDDWSLQAADFINRLLQRKPNSRLGHTNIDEIFKHPWLRNYPMEMVQSGTLQPPWHPDLKKVGWDEQDFSSEDTQTKELVAQNQIMLRNQEIQQLFQGYHFNRIPLK